MPGHARKGGVPGGSVLGGAAPSAAGTCEHDARSGGVARSGHSGRMVARSARDGCASAARESGARISLISSAGKRAARFSAIMRILSALGSGMALVGCAHVLGAYIEAGGGFSGHRGGGVSEQFVFGQLADGFSGQLGDSFPASLSSMLALIIAGIVLAVCAAGADCIAGGIGARAEERRLRRRILSATYSGANLDNDSRTGTQPADVVSLLTDGCEKVSEFRIGYLGSTVAALIIPVLTLIYVSIAISPSIGIVLLISYPLVPLIVGGFMSIFRARSHASRKERHVLAVEYMDAIRNLITIRLVGAGARVEKRLREQGEKNRRAIMKVLAGNQIVIILLDGLVGLLWISLAAILAYVHLRSADITVADALSVIFLIVLIIEPIAQVAGFFYVGMGGLASGKAIKEYLKRKKPRKSPIDKAGADADGSRARDKAGADSAASTGAGADMGDGDALVDLSHLGYAYENGVPVLKDLTLAVRPGERVAIVGPSGVGKSTLLSILSGDIQCSPSQGSASPSQGEALDSRESRAFIGGLDIMRVAPHEIRALSAVVAQRTWLFSGTIADNLRIASPHAPEQAMWEALESAHLAEDVRRMPTDVGERGALLSGGQAQRLSLARAFLSGRSLWILDEPTAHVDARSEQEIIEVLAHVPRSITLMMSTHRPALRAVADRVYEMRAGSLELIKDERAALSVGDAALSGEGASQSRCEEK